MYHSEHLCFGWNHWASRAHTHTGGGDRLTLSLAINFGFALAGRGGGTDRQYMLPAYPLQLMTVSCFCVSCAA